jgi:hypothetical protein
MLAHEALFFDKRRPHRCGGARVINLGGDVVGKCSTRRAGAGSGPGLNPAAGVCATFTGGAALASIGAVFGAVARSTGRTGGGAMGLPGRTACRVGLMYGCGTTCVLLSRSGGTRTTWCATGCPLRKTSAGTEVVATVRYAKWILLMLVTFRMFVARAPVIPNQYLLGSGQYLSLIELTRG